jgi:hypothetical protein
MGGKWLVSFKTAIDHCEWKDLIFNSEYLDSINEKFIILTIVLGLTTCTYIVENDLTTNSPIATINDSTTTTKDIVIQADNAFELHKNYLVKDIDDDNVKDTIYVDLEKSTIVCKLSSNGFKEISSKPIGILNLQSGVIETRNGFEFFNDWMRAGYKNKFIYNNKTKKIQLIETLHWGREILKLF